MNNEDQTQILFIMQKVFEGSRAEVAKGNYPWYAIITDKNFKIISESENTTRKDVDSTAHAEINVIRKASKILERRNLQECKIFVNAESCPMCAAAIIRSGIGEVYYGAPQESHTNPNLHFAEIAAKSSSPPKITSGIMEAEFKKIIQDSRREEGKGVFK